MSLNKKELIAEVAFAEGISQKQAESVINAVLKSVTRTVQSGETVDLHGFGKFKAHHSPARTGRNPATGEPVEIAAKNGIKFTPAKALKDLLNK